MSLSEVLVSLSHLGMKGCAFSLANTPEKISHSALAFPFAYLICRVLCVTIQGRDKISEFRNRQMSGPEDTLVKFNRLRTLLP